MRAQIAIGTYRIEGYYNECPCRLLCNPEEIWGKKYLRLFYIRIPRETEALLDARGRRCFEWS